MGILESLANAFVGTNVAGDTVVEVRLGGKVVITDDGEGHKTKYTVDKVNKTYKKESKC